MTCRNNSRILAMMLVVFAGMTTTALGQCFDVVENHMLAPEYGDAYYSERIEVDGDVLVVSNRESEQAHVFRLSGENWELEQTLFLDYFDPNTQSFGFGRAVDVSGDTIVVAAGTEPVGPLPPLHDGKIHVYQYEQGPNGMEWAHKQALHLADDHGVNGRFATFQSLAIDGDWIITSTSDECCFMTECPNECFKDIYIYKRVNGIWTLHQELDAIDPDQNEIHLDNGLAAWGFGCIELVGDQWQETTNCPPGPNQNHLDDLNGDSAAVGADVWRKINGTWQHTATMPGNPPGIGAIDGDRFVVGDPEFGGFNDFKGRGDLFELVNGQWQHQRDLMPSYFIDSQYFGRSLAMQGDRIFCGGKKGVVYGYDLGAQPPSPWPLQSTMVDHPNPQDWDFFGSAVAMGQDHAIIGIRAESTSVTAAGAAAIYELQNGVWISRGIVFPTNPEFYQLIGTSVDVSGTGDDVVMVMGGAGYCDGINADSGGGAYVIQPDGSNWSIQELEPTDPIECNGDVPDNYGRSISVAGEGNQAVIAVGAHLERTGNVISHGAVSIFTHDGNSWVNNHTLLVTPLARTVLGSSVRLAHDNGYFKLRAVGLDSNLFEQTYEWYSVDGGQTWSGPTILSAAGDWDVTLAERFGYQWSTSSRLEARDGWSFTHAAGYEAWDSLPRLTGEYSDCTRQVVLPPDMSDKGDNFGMSWDLAVIEGQLHMIVGAPSASQGGQGRGYAVFVHPEQTSAGPGDATGDGLVDLGDLLVVIDVWGPCDGPCPADFDGNLAVDVVDLLIVVDFWTL